MATGSGSHPNVDRLSVACELAEHTNKLWAQYSSDFELDLNDLPTDPGVNRVCIKINNPSSITLVTPVAREGGSVRPLKRMMQLIITHLSTVTNDDSIGITDIFDPLDVLAIAESIHGSCDLSNILDVKRRIKEDTCCNEHDI